MTDDSPGVLNATRDFILDQLEEACSKGDLTCFIFGFGGHGCKLNGHRYLCLPTTKESRLATSSLSFNDLFNDITLIAALHTLVVTDCCQTTFHRGLSDMMTDEEEDAVAQFATTTACDVKAKRRENNYAHNVDPTVGILNACSSGQMSHEIPNGKYGFFTDSLLTVMEELASQGNGSVCDLANRVNERVNNLARRYGIQQNSYSKFEGAGSFSFPVTFRSFPIGDPPPKKTLEDWLQDAESKVDATSRLPLKQAYETLQRAKLALDSARFLLEPDDVRNELLLARLDARYQSVKGRLVKVDQGWKAVKSNKPGEALRLAESVLLEKPDHVAALELKNFTQREERLAKGNALLSQDVLDETLAVADLDLVRESGNKDALKLKDHIEVERWKLKTEECRRHGETGRQKLKEKGQSQYSTSWLNLPLRPGEQRSLMIKGVECKFSFIPKGSFLMGSPSNEKKRNYDETLHRVNLSQDFWLMSYPVTQDLYEAVSGNKPFFNMDDKDGKLVTNVRTLFGFGDFHFEKGDKFPVINVSGLSQWILWRN